ncbi:SDR family oxidoreductase [Granulosicoccus sp.]|nr:SDR family oxidoreductase [Granulosicoccus sp.]MDB4222912.1 SDR family oxidoreductase [Granulosicoccus sp.]
MSTDKNQRTALVTGSGRNIGRAIAMELAAEGCNVILNGSSNRAACESVAREIESAGANVLIAMGDVGVRDEALAIAESGIQQFGRIDVLVNNAAIRPSFDLVNDDETQFHRIMDINFHAALWLSRACLPGMIDNGWGRVINFTGMNAQQGYPGKSAVTISKHANWGLTKSIAKEYGRKGVTANIISPGTITDDVEDSGSKDKYETLKQQNPAGRLGDPLDIAKMVRYLSSDQAGFVNGQLMQVNGGVVV